MRDEGVKRRDEGEDELDEDEPLERGEHEAGKSTHQQLASQHRTLYRCQTAQLVLTVLILFAVVTMLVFAIMTFLDLNEQGKTYNPRFLHFFVAMDHVITFGNKGEKFDKLYRKVANIPYKGHRQSPKSILFSRCYCHTP